MPHSKDPRDQRLALSKMERLFPTGSILFNEGDKTNDLYLLKEGSVEILKERSCVAVIDEPGSYFGEMSTLLNVPRSATVRAKERSILYVVPGHKVEDFFTKNPLLALKLARAIAQRLLNTTVQLVNKKSTGYGLNDVLPDEKKEESMNLGDEKEFSYLRHENSSKAQGYEEEEEEEFFSDEESVELEVAFAAISTSANQLKFLEMYVRGLGGRTTVSRIYVALDIPEVEIDALCRIYCSIGLMYKEDADIYFLESTDVALRTEIHEWAISHNVPWTDGSADY